MKLKSTMLSMMAGTFLIMQSNAQIDLAIGNIDAGWDTYYTSTNQITGVYFDVLNNENGAAPAFDIKLYLVDPNDANTNYVVWTYTDGDGQNGNTVVTWSNIDVDFDDTPGIPSGYYRLAVCVDPDDVITETNENNNCLYISTPGNNLYYNAGGSVGLDDYYANEGVLVYPNPVVDQLTFVKKENWDEATISILDMNGKEIFAMNLKGDKMIIDMSEYSPGLYIYKVSGSDGSVLSTGKLIKQ